MNGAERGHFTYEEKTPQRQKVLITACEDMANRDVLTDLQRLDIMSLAWRETVSKVDHQALVN